MINTLKTREFWLVVIGALAAILKALNVPMVDALIQQYGEVWAGLLVAFVGGKILKDGQVPFVPADAAKTVTPVVGLLLAGSLLWAPSVQAADLSDVVQIYGGVNGAWYDGGEAAFPQDVEIGGNAAVSLSPHLAAVGATYYGFDHSYLRYSVGGRITATDVNDPNFSVGLGLQYHGASQSDLDPSEWAPDASFGWRFAPESLPRLLVVGQGSYGLTSSRVRAILGLRWAIPL